MKTKLCTLFIFLIVALGISAQNHMIPPTTEGWSQIHNASVNQTDSSIIYGSVGTRNGNFIMSDDVFNLSGKTVKLKWRFNGGSARTYYRGAIRIYHTSLLITIPSNGILVDDTWCYTTMTINDDKTYSFSTCTGNYHAEGGSLVGSVVSGTCSDDDWYEVLNAGILFYWDDAGADTKLTISKTQIIDCSPKNLQGVKCLDFEDGNIPSDLITSGAWQVVSPGNAGSSKCLYISGSNSNRLTIVNKHASAIRMDVKVQYLTAVRLIMGTNNIRFNLLSDYESGSASITPGWQTITIPLPKTGDNSLFLEFYTEYSSESREFWVDNITYLNEIDQPTHIQTDWSGGDGQVDAFVDTTAFNSQFNIDYLNATGELTATSDDALSFYGMAFYNGKMAVGTSQGVFLYDTLRGSWDMLFEQRVERITVHNGKLYAEYGLSVYEYDGSNDNYGFGFNGWKLHSQLSTTFNAIYCLESIGGELMIGSRYTSGSSGCVLVWDGNSWGKRGNSIENGVLSLAYYDGETFAGTHWGSDIYRWNGTAWIEVLNPSLMTVLDFVVFKGDLYAAMYSSNYVTGAIYKYNGTAWSSVYSGDAIISLTVANDKMYAVANKSAGSSVLVSSDGSSYTTPFVTPRTTEKNIYQVCSDGTNLYYGCINGIHTGDFYINGSINNQLTYGELTSSQMSLTGSEVIKAELIADIPGETGVVVCVKGVNANATNWQDISKGSYLDLEDSLVVYKLGLWSAGVDSMASVSEVNILEQPLQTIVFDELSDKTYGDVAFQLTAEGGESGEDLSYISSDTTVASLSDTTGAWVLTIHKVGVTAITALQDGSAFYAPSEVAQQLSVTKAQLNVEVDNKLRLQGESNPLFTYTISGFVNDEDSTILEVLPTLECVADESSSVGQYDIIASAASDSNYTFSYTDGTLTVDVATALTLEEANINAIWPNPTSGVLNVEGPVGVHYSVVNLSGVIVKEGTIMGTTIDISNCKSGLYIVKIADDQILIVKE